MTLRKFVTVLCVAAVALASFSPVVFAAPAIAASQQPGQDPAFYRGVTSTTSSATVVTDETTTLSRTDVSVSTRSESVTGDPYATSNSVSTVTIQTKTLPTGMIQVRPLQTTVTTTDTNVDTIVTTTTDTTTTVTTTVTPVTVYTTTTTTERHRGAPGSNGVKLSPIVTVTVERVVGTPVVTQTSNTVTEVTTSTTTTVIDTQTTTTEEWLDGWHAPIDPA